jgi:hypothetical protein
MAQVEEHCTVMYQVAEGKEQVSSVQVMYIKN